MECPIDILWLNFSKKYYDAVTRMARVQTEKLALQMTVNFQGQLTRPAGVAGLFATPPPLNITLTKHCPVLHAHFIHTVYDFAPTNYSLTELKTYISNFYLCKVGQK